MYTTVYTVQVMLQCILCVFNYLYTPQIILVYTIYFVRVGLSWRRVVDFGEKKCVQVVINMNIRIKKKKQKTTSEAHTTRSSTVERNLIFYFSTPPLIR